MTEELLTLALNRNATLTENALREIYLPDEDLDALLRSEQ